MFQEKLEWDNNSLFVFLYSLRRGKNWPSYIADMRLSNSSPPHENRPFTAKPAVNNSLPKTIAAAHIYSADHTLNFNDGSYIACAFQCTARRCSFVLSLASRFVLILSGWLSGWMSVHMQIPSWISLLNTAHNHPRPLPVHKWRRMQVNESSNMLE